MVCIYDKVFRVWQQECVALGVVLQVLFPKALVFVNADISGNLIGLIGQFSGAGLVGMIAVGVFVYLLRRA